MPRCLRRESRPRPRTYPGPVTGSTPSITAPCTSPAPCKAATARPSPHRPTPALAALVGEDWARLRHLPPAWLPADWRTRRVTVHIAGVGGLPARAFLDVEAPQTHQVLRLALAAALLELAYPDLDVAAVRGPDRRLTRLLATWAWQQRDVDGRPRYAGLRYLSRLNNDWECWAIFDDVPLINPIEHSIPADDEALATVADLFNLHVR